MRVSVILAALAVVASTAAALGQSDKREAHIGYIYPAGGKQGTTFEVWVGGQFLYGARQVFVSGEGVEAEVVKHYRPLRNVQKPQRDALRKKMIEVRNKRIAERTGRKPPSLSVAGTDRAGSNRFLTRLAKADSTDDPQAKNKTRFGKGKATKAKPAPDGAADELPSHPMLSNMDDKTLRELEHIRHELEYLRLRQFNPPIAETVLVKVTIDRNAPPGDRELRVLGALGLSNPMCFQVGTLPEHQELESNDPDRKSPLPDDPPLDLPVLINGQIRPGDVDRFRFRAQRGQQLVIAAAARRLVPYLADAVPGWFQATLALYDAAGREVAFEDDYRFDPDPVVFYEVPADGVYTVEIRDAIYRGREDFVYRIAVGEQPFVTQAYPLGARVNSRAAAELDGWNLPRKRVSFKTRFGQDTIRQVALQRGGSVSNPVVYAVDRLNESDAVEPDDTIQQAEGVELPRIINGRIDRPGDVDVFRFQGRAGAWVVAEVVARRLHSPLDSLLRLTDASGKVLAWNDDHEDKELGLLTHHADAYLRAKLPADGDYLVHLSDAQQHGGPAYAYRLRLSPPRPDVALRMVPSSITMRAGGSAAICVYALRKDGFDGDVGIVLAEDAPPGFSLSGATIPKGRDKIRMTLTAPPRFTAAPVALRLEGRATVGRRTITRPVVPSEDMMQAFLYRHLVPSQELLVAVRGGKRRGPGVQVATSDAVRIPQDGQAEVRFKVPSHPMFKKAMERIELELNDPPKGLKLAKVEIDDGRLALLVKTDGELKPGFEDNLIVEAFTEFTPRRAKGKSANKPRRVSIGVLPAVPYEIVTR